MSLRGKINPEGDMDMKNKLTEKQAWEIFAQTGDIRAYLLYKASCREDFRTEVSEEPDGYELLFKRISESKDYGKPKRKRPKKH